LRTLRLLRGWRLLGALRLSLPPLFLPLLLRLPRVIRIAFLLFPGIALVPVALTVQSRR